MIRKRNDDITSVRKGGFYRESFDYETATQHEDPLSSSILVPIHVHFQSPHSISVESNKVDKRHYFNVFNT